MDDLISRRAAIEYFQRIIDATSINTRYNMGFADGLEFCTNHLSTMSSAQPERKKGHWILSDIQREEDVSNGNYQFYCSECDKGDLHCKDTIVSFCWNCGAYMREEADDE